MVGERRGSGPRIDPAALGEFGAGLALARAEKTQEQARRGLVELGLITAAGTLAVPYKTQPGDEPTDHRRPGGAGAGKLSEDRIRLLERLAKRKRPRPRRGSKTT